MPQIPGRSKIISLGPTPDLARAECAIRALSQVGRPVKYHLPYPNGGTNPSAKGPEDVETMQADCIADAAWNRGFDRFQYNFPLYDGYINTDSMLDEAMLRGSNTDTGRQIAKSAPWFKVLAAPLIGCFLVGRTFFSKTRLRNVTGHIGTVVEIHPGGEDGRDLSKIMVVHCSPYNYQFTDGKSAIWKTDARIWGAYPTLKFVDFVWSGGPR